MTQHARLEKNVFVRFVVEKSSYEYMVKLTGLTVEEFKKLSLEQVEEKINNKYELMSEEEWEEFWIDCMEQDNKKLGIGIDKIDWLKECTNKP